jgi:hypothetical protein
MEGRIENVELRIENVEVKKWTKLFLILNSSFSIPPSPVLQAKPTKKRLITLKIVFKPV